MVSMSDAPIVVSAPGSTANLGPGFDVLGLAVDLRAEVGLGPQPGNAHMVDEHHPGVIAYRRAGGTATALWSRSRLPMGRGLGYSGSVRAAGAMLAVVEAHGPDAASDPDHRAHVTSIASTLEGHPDNAAASVHGGLVIASPSGSVTPVPVTVDVALLVWIPETTTSTDQSRTTLGTSVDRRDAVANIAAVANLIVGCTTGDLEALRAGCHDRLHQPTRLEAVPASRDALTNLLELGALGAWLSGSGPTVAAFVRRDEAERIGASLSGGRVSVIEIDTIGVTAHVGIV